MNYIGIRGHRGAGKMSVAWLLGVALDTIKNDKNWDEEFEAAITRLKSSDFEMRSDSIDIDYASFGDTPKSLVEMLLGCPREYIYNDYNKDHMYVRMGDFRTFIDPHDCKIFHWSKDSTAIPQPDEYMSMRDFIMYFGMTVMQQHFGQNVWVKSMERNDDKFGSFEIPGISTTNQYIIYSDVKAPTEVSYIKDHNGIIINVIRKDHRKGSGIDDSLKDDNRIDYTIELHGTNLYDIKDKILKLAKDIYESNCKDKETR